MYITDCFLFCLQSTEAPYTTQCSTDVLLNKIVNYEDPDHRSHRLVVMVKDHLGLQIQQEFVFNIVNCNEPPYVSLYKCKA